MKYKVVLILGLLFLICGRVHSQTIQFCENVDNAGNAVKPASVIAIDKSGGKVKFLVKLPHRVGTSKVMYEIHRASLDGSQEYERTINQDTHSDQTWFWTEVEFKKDGAYNIYAFDGDRNQLASGQLTIQYY